MAINKEQLKLVFLNNSGALQTIISTSLHKYKMMLNVTRRKGDLGKAFRANTWRGNATHLQSIQKPKISYTDTAKTHVCNLFIFENFMFSVHDHLFMRGRPLNHIAARLVAVVSFSVQPSYLSISWRMGILNESTRDRM